MANGKQMVGALLLLQPAYYIKAAHWLRLLCIFGHSFHHLSPIPSRVLIPLTCLVGPQSTLQPQACIRLPRPHPVTAVDWRPHLPRLPFPSPSSRSVRCSTCTSFVLATTARMYPRPRKGPTEARCYIAVLTNRNTDVPHVLGRDIYTTSRSAFDRLVAIVPPCGSIGSRCHETRRLCLGPLVAQRAWLIPPAAPPGALSNYFPALHAGDREAP
ncbi:hypothetical protein DFH07DRAFT_967679 [Mycena maculata]|uniref:Uncharacterized protein n=1 Tax=Mycena maculata TaxID=230809 RepID=A0AAD7I573_9AGAR|nr:hypothetical protein DFH07DRAFT_967679 [Mycena maculata]